MAFVGVFPGFHHLGQVIQELKNILAISFNKVNSRQRLLTSINIDYFTL